MRKVYKEANHICNSDSKKFVENVGTTVCQYENKGYEVEIQYKTGQSYDMMFFTALVLGYKMEED